MSHVDSYAFVIHVVLADVCMVCNKYRQATDRSAIECDACVLNQSISFFIIGFAKSI